MRSVVPVHAGHPLSGKEPQALFRQFELQLDNSPLAFSLIHAFQLVGESELLAAEFSGHTSAPPAG